MIFKYFLIGSLFFHTLNVVAAESEQFADKVIDVHELSGSGAQKLKNILTRQPYLTRNIHNENPDELQGPHYSMHPASRASCVNKVLLTGLIHQKADFKAVCGSNWMAPVLEFPGQELSQAKVCIDQFEFPNIPCEYPVVWTPASTAKAICASMGKRLCNSHEWEGSCAGHLDKKDPYLFKLSSLQDRKSTYNKNRQVTYAFNWNSNFKNLTDSKKNCGVYTASDTDIDPQIRANLSKYYASNGKSKQCNSDYQTCGSNTWPAGFKYLCKTELDVFDMHGNVAELTNFPTSEAGLARGNTTDKTERKGSFFVDRQNLNYPDDCRVRQPYEHFNNIDTDQHSFYQEGFRCCKDL